MPTFARSDAARSRAALAAALPDDTHEALAGLVRDEYAAPAQKSLSRALADNDVVDIDITPTLEGDLGPLIDDIGATFSDMGLDVFDAVRGAAASDEAAQAATALRVAVATLREVFDALRPVLRVAAGLIGEAAGRIVAELVKAAIAGASTAPEGGVGAIGAVAVGAGSVALGLGKSAARQLPGAVSQSAKSLAALLVKQSLRRTLASQTVRALGNGAAHCA